MMQYIDMNSVTVSSPLRKVHYPFARGKELEQAFSRCLTNYYSKSCTGKKFDAHGLLVTGKSRVGKSRELDHLITKFNDSKTEMFDGRPGRIISCSLWGRTTWKELGSTTLEALGYPTAGRRTQGYIWGMVVDQAKRQGVIGIHYDECQHMFTDTGEAQNRVILDSFKALLKEPKWPMVLILSGVPTLAQHIEKERASEDRRQLRYLLRPIHFETISPSQDIEELNALAFTYAEKAEISFSDLSNEDFLKRLIYGCAFRWGLVIEMLIEALTICIGSGSKNATIDHFVEAFTQIYGTPKGYSPFTMPDYQGSFDPDKLMTLLDRDT